MRKNASFFWFFSGERTGSNWVESGTGVVVYRLSENVFIRPILYYILTNSLELNSIWYASVVTISFSDNLFRFDLSPFS